jgi:hypothetical protein
MGKWPSFGVLNDAKSAITALLAGKLVIKKKTSQLTNKLALT